MVSLLLLLQLARHLLLLLSPALLAPLHDPLLHALDAAPLLFVTAAVI
jgi:hypothetical protein